MPDKDTTAILAAEAVRDVVDCGRVLTAISPTYAFAYTAAENAVRDAVAAGNTRSDLRAALVLSLELRALHHGCETLAAGGR